MLVLLNSGLNVDIDERVPYSRLFQSITRVVQILRAEHAGARCDCS